MRNLIFSRCQIWSIFTVFRYFSIFFDRFRSFSIVYTPGSVRKRSELFEAKIRGRMGVERAVLMCATRQYLSRAGGDFRAFFKFLELTSKFAWFFISGVPNWTVHNSAFFDHIPAAPRSHGDISIKSNVISECQNRQKSPAEAYR